MERAADWVTGVIRFLRSNTPGDSRGSWETRGMSAFEASCEALVALGQAEASRFGAMPRAHPEVPPVLPDLGFIQTTILDLAEQVGKLEYRPRATEAGGLGDGPTLTHAAPISDSRTIEGEAPLGPARATPEVVALLGDLGLVHAGQWTAEAAGVLRAIRPEAWNAPRATPFKP